MIRKGFMPGILLGIVALIVGSVLLIGSLLGMSTQYNGAYADIDATDTLYGAQQIEDNFVKRGQWDMFNLFLETGDNASFSFEISYTPLLGAPGMPDPYPFFSINISVKDSVGQIVRQAHCDYSDRVNPSIFLHGLWNVEVVFSPTYSDTYTVHVEGVAYNGIVQFVNQDALIKRGRPDPVTFTSGLASIGVSPIIVLASYFLSKRSRKI